jgi:NADPH:quinone reductase-like Zn-dependent oxidoreductase
MKSYHLTYGGGIESLVLREHEIPKPGRGEVLVRVRATSLNARELMILRGDYPLPVKADVVAVSDGAGEVVGIGEGVTRLKIGDRVAASLFPLWIDGPFSFDLAPQIGGSLDGMLTEYAVLNEQGLVVIPEHLSFEEAATLPCAGVTAWHALTGGRPPVPGDTVLTLGSGGVSLFALQFAKLYGARVITTTSSDEKAKRLKTLGADEVINYRTVPEWPVAVRNLTGGRGVDYVIEVGGAGTLPNSLKSVAVQGQISWVGVLASGEPAISLSALRSAFANLRFVAVGNRAQFVAMNRAIEVNRLKPVIDRVFPFAKAADAFRYYQTGQFFGKIVIKHE